MNYIHALFVIIIGLCVCSCVQFNKPTLDYYNEYTRCVYMFGEGYKKANYLHGQLDPRVSATVDNFLETNKKFSSLGTYRSLDSAINGMIHGNFNLAGVDVSGHEMATITGAYQGSFDLIETEMKRFKLDINSVDFSRIKQEVIDELDQKK